MESESKTIEGTLTEKQYDVSVLVLTYNPDINKMLMTVHSALMQRNVSLEIVVADDGSAENHFDQLQRYLEQNNFSDYQLIIRKQNHGTVWSMWEALSHCRGKYVKNISPGDMLLGDDLLYSWISCMKEKKWKVSFCDAIYYRFEAGEIVPLAVKAHPCRISEIESVVRYNQLVLDDIWLGACEVSEVKTAYKYISLVVGKVKYAEDHIYRLMSFCGENLGYFHRAGVLYETGTGISTSNNTLWSKRLHNDWKNADQILKKCYCPDAKLKAQVLKTVQIREVLEDDNIAGWRKRLCMIQKLVCIKGAMSIYLEKRFKCRMTDTNLNKVYINQILNFQESAG